MTTYSTQNLDAFNNIHDLLQGIHCNAAYVLLESTNTHAKTDLENRITILLNTSKDILLGMPQTYKLLKEYDIENPNHVQCIVQATKEDAQGMKNLKFIIGKIKELSSKTPELCYPTPPNTPNRALSNRQS